MRGPKPKPSARKRLEGIHRRINTDEPKVPAPPDTFDVPPPELDGHAIASAEWLRLAPTLRRLKVVTELDRAALAALTLEWERYVEATAQIRKLGMVVKAPSGYPIVNPYLSIATRALAGCARLWPELGLTPSSRTRVHANGPGVEPDEFSEFDPVH